MFRNVWGKMAFAFLAVLLVGGSVFGIERGSAAASGEPSAAMTSPPPIQPLSIFDPNHLYLSSGSNSISAQSGKVSINASTYATAVVDTIGITVYVEKWNGTSWETVGLSSTASGNDLSGYSSAFSKNVTAGYYYRARTVHWIIEGTVYEEGERFSATVLGI